MAIIKESVLYRAFIAFPLIALIPSAFNRMTAEAVTEEIEEMLRSSIIKWDGGSFHMRQSFFKVKWLDDIRRPLTIAFAV